MYKADIVSAKINNGLLSVEVLFHSDEDSFTDTFQTNQSQKGNWLGEQVERKLNHLDSISLIRDSISVGAYQTGVQEGKTEREIYHEKTTKYLNYMNTARMGIINHDRPIISELREWLRANFKDEYI